MKTNERRSHLPDAFIDVEVKLPAHIEADSVAVTGLVIDVDERDSDGVRALRVEGHAVRPAVLGVREEFIRAFPRAELTLDLVHLLPSSLRRHL